MPVGKLLDQVAVYEVYVTLGSESAVHFLEISWLPPVIAIQLGDQISSSVRAGEITRLFRPAVGGANDDSADTVLSH